MCNRRRKTMFDLITTELNFFYAKVNEKCNKKLVNKNFLLHINEFE